MHEDNMHLVGIFAQQTSSLTAASSLQPLLAVLLLTLCNSISILKLTWLYKV